MTEFGFTVIVPPVAGAIAGYYLGMVTGAHEIYQLAGIFIGLALGIYGAVLLVMHLL
jgi:hypothetical protein